MYIYILTHYIETLTENNVSSNEYSESWFDIERVR